MLFNFDYHYYETYMQHKIREKTHEDMRAAASSNAAIVYHLLESLESGKYYS